MDSNSRQRRIYMRNALVCFVCTAVCLGIDIRHFILEGQIRLTIETGVSCALYILLILLGIRAVRKYNQMRHTDSTT